MFYQVTSDTAVPEHGAPRPCYGAPLPFTISEEERLLLAYYVEPIVGEPPGMGPPVVVSSSTEAEIAVIDFWNPHAFFSAPVSDEVFDAHPLAYRGLSAGGVFRVDESSWIRRLVAIQYAHRRPLPGVYDQSKHYIFAFKDSIFECVANGYEVLLRRGSMDRIEVEMIQRMRSAS